MIVIAELEREVVARVILGGDGAQPQRADVVAAGNSALPSTSDQANTVVPANSGDTCRPPLIAAMWKALASPLKESARASEITWPP